jgi:hypothetical protein
VVQFISLPMNISMIYDAMGTRSSHYPICSFNLELMHEILIARPNEVY